MMGRHEFAGIAHRAQVLAVIVAANLVGKLPALPAAGADEPPPFGIESRIPWTTSRVVGSPEPPLPFTVERTLTKLTWKAPLFVTAEPDTDSMLVVEKGDEKEPSRILRVRDDPNADHADTVLELGNRLIYSLAFHPDFRTNGQIYVFTHGLAGEVARTNQILRFTVERQGTRACEPQSERLVIQWRSEGHDGGGLVFGRDGMLYISSGDGTTDSDGWVTGQDLSEFLGGVLRIDVDHSDGVQEYSVPADNPFIGTPNARPENWAYGLRNPWRLCVDEKTGQIWTGNNGQDRWETVHLVRRGENYGWSVYEGNHPFYLNRKPGPTPVVPPTAEHPHSEARSLTGGVVYHGDAFPELEGGYIYGDYSTGRIWGIRHDGLRVLWQKELADTQLQIAAFAVSHRGELLVVDHAGGIYRLVRTRRQESVQKFPALLSQTGLFRSTKEHHVEPGLIPYSVIAEGWADGAFVERFMALPADSRIGQLASGTVFVQTLSLQRESENPASRRRIETRLLTLQDGEWFGYSYRWDNDQSDATLVGATGDGAEFAVKDDRVPGGSRRQAWRFPSRAECMTCHSRAAGFVLGITELQLNRVHDYGGVCDNQLRTLQHIGVFTGALPKAEAERLVNPYDTNQTLDARVRSYLHVNCSVCHVEAGGGNSKLELGFATKPERMNLINARPQHDAFNIDNAMLVFPGDPGRSILYQRLSRRQRGQMPPLVTTEVDERAVAMIRDWIHGMKPEQTFVRDWKMDDLLPSLDQVKQGRSFESGRTAFRQTGCIQCHRFGGEGGSVGPDLGGVGRRLGVRDLLESLLLPSNVIAEGYALTAIGMKSGEVVTGRIERSDDQEVTIRPPAAPEEPVTIRTADIRERNVAKISNMPPGILNTLDRAQVLDLLAYLISDGESAHAAFQPPAPAPESK